MGVRQCSLKLTHPFLQRLLLVLLLHGGDGDLPRHQIGASVPAQPRLNRGGSANAVGLGGGVEPAELAGRHLGDHLLFEGFTVAGCFMRLHLVSLPGVNLGEDETRGCKVKARRPPALPLGYEPSGSICHLMGDKHRQPNVTMGVNPGVAAAARR